MGVFLESQNDTSYNCSKCNAELTFPPGATSLTCDYCGNVEQIGRKGEVKELDYHIFLQLAEKNADSEDIEYLDCDGCGAQITINETTHSDRCPYCGKTYVTTTSETGHTIPPGALLPFKITKEDSLNEYRQWVKKRWFAPNRFKEAAKKNDSLEGVYLPHWTFDSDTTSEYTGKKGIDYYTTETYTTTENGRSVTKTRQVKRTRWYYVSGTVSKYFNDVITPASDSLPRKYVEKLEPWDIHELEPFNEAFLQGYRSERYTINLEYGFENAKDEMESEIRSKVRYDIGGDHQVITGLWTDYQDIMFKHVLLPVWVTAYRYKDNVFRIVINARTGEVQGERPWSWVKITFAVIALMILIYAIFLAAQ